MLNGVCDICGGPSQPACDSPYEKPDVLNVNLPNGPINLKGPIPIYPGEPAKGGWASSVIQSNVGLAPAADELVRLAQPLDLYGGELLADATFPYPNPPTKVKNPSVVFSVPISFTASGAQFTGPNYSCSTGSTCVPPIAADGTSALYLARVEDCLSSIHHLSIPQVKDFAGNPIPCNSADGIAGTSGYWYDIAPPWSATATLDFGAGKVPPQDGGMVSGILNVPAQLPVPGNSVRIEFELGITNANIVPGSPFINSLAWGDVFSAGAPLGCCEYALTRFAVQFNPINVLPAAFLQMKLLPYTILYRPPGDQSSGTFKATESFATSMSIGSSTTVDTSKSFEKSSELQDDQKVTAFIATIQQIDGQSTTTSTTWDSNAVIGKGLTDTASRTIVRAWTVGSNSADASIVPAREYVVPNTCTKENYATNNCSVKPAESYQQEPFWADRIVLLLNPQAALWDFNGTPGMQLLGAVEFDEVSIRDLDVCANNLNPQAWRLSNGQWLSPSECQDLVALDPFYGIGQSLDPSLSGRGLPVGGGPYGRDPVNPNSSASATFQDIFSYQTAQSTNGTATFSTSVTDVIGFSWSESVALAYQQGQYGVNVGFNKNVTLKQGEKVTTGTSMKISYTASTISTDTRTTEIDGMFADDHDFDTPACQGDSGKCYRPSVRVFIDEIFGSYMFQDRDAPGPLPSGMHFPPPGGIGPGGIGPGVIGR
ncbi:hypothetical protein SAMN05444159_0748 [Bradyrhizobium lablabi]|uniref:Uncharacterized protein n=1 Tax=Bradyrhizobium lablabi TaxID=722472 RepID=A0A1M6JQN8_9BRAD|nr:hypothetical protein SAMN05444159_0748 [Bradyrhizobium lablabi]